MDAQNRAMNRGAAPIGRLRGAIMFCYSCMTDKLPDQRRPTACHPDAVRLSFAAATAGLRGGGPPAKHQQRRRRDQPVAAGIDPDDRPARSAPRDLVARAAPLRILCDRAWPHLSAAGAPVLRAHPIGAVRTDRRDPVRRSSILAAAGKQDHRLAGPQPDCDLGERLVRPRGTPSGRVTAVIASLRAATSNACCGERSTSARRGDSPPRRRAPSWHGASRWRCGKSSTGSRSWRGARRRHLANNTRKHSAFADAPPFGGDQRVLGLVSGCLRAGAGRSLRCPAG